MQLVVTAKRLNKRKSVPARMSDRDSIIGEVKEGFSFVGEEVAPSLLPNPALGKWYKDRDGYFYWGGGVVEVVKIGGVPSVPQDEIDKFLSIAHFPPEVINWHRRIRLPDTVKQKQGQGIRIAVLDTGIEKTHLDLLKNIFASADFTNSSFGDTDMIGHGSSMASFIAANKYFSDKGISGVAPLAKLISAKVMYEENDPQNFLSVGEGIKYAINQKADIVNLSIGNDKDVPSVSIIINNAATMSKIVFVAATRQYDQSLPLLQFPCNCPEVIPVTAMPKDYILSHWNTLPSPLIIFPKLKSWSCNIQDNHYYAQDSGSSVACAFLSGLIGLILSNNPALNRSKASILSELAKYSTSIEDAFVNPEQEICFIYKP